MGIIKLAYQDKRINVTPSDFGKKLAKAMKDIASSNVYFIMQQAYGDIDYSECELIWKEVLTNKSKVNLLTPPPQTTKK